MASRARCLAKSCRQLLQGHVMLGHNSPAIVSAQQLSQNSLFKQQDLLFPAWAVTKSSVVRDF